MNAFNYLSTCLYFSLQITTSASRVTMVARSSASIATAPTLAVVARDTSLPLTHAPALVRRGEGFGEGGVRGICLVALNHHNRCRGIDSFKSHT